MSSSGGECPVCLEALFVGIDATDGSTVSSLGTCVPCGHVLHEACFAAWKKTAATGVTGSNRRRKTNGRVGCPICRQSTAQFVKLFWDLPVVSSTPKPASATPLSQPDSQDDQTTSAFSQGNDRPIRGRGANAPRMWDGRQTTTRRRGRRPPRATTRRTTTATDWARDASYLDLLSDSGPSTRSQTRRRPNESRPTAEPEFAVDEESFRPASSHTTGRTSRRSSSSREGHSAPSADRSSNMSESSSASPTSTRKRRTWNDACQELWGALMESSSSVAWSSSTSSGTSREECVGHRTRRARKSARRG